MYVVYVVYVVFGRSLAIHEHCVMVHIHFRILDGIVLSWGQLFCVLALNPKVGNCNKKGWPRMFYEHTFYSL